MEKDDYGGWKFSEVVVCSYVESRKCIYEIGILDEVFKWNFKSVNLFILVVYDKIGKRER